MTIIDEQTRNNSHLIWVKSICSFWRTFRTSESSFTSSDFREPSDSEVPSFEASIFLKARRDPDLSFSRVISAKKWEERRNLNCEVECKRRDLKNCSCHERKKNPRTQLNIRIYQQLARLIHSPKPTKTQRDRWAEREEVPDTTKIDRNMRERERERERRKKPSLVDRNEVEGERKRAKNRLRSIGMRENKTVFSH